MIVTPLYAGLLALWFVVLSLRVIARRRGEAIFLGDGGDAVIIRRIRAHGNFAEYVPLVLLLMLMLELSGTAPVWALHAVGLILLVGRLLHGYALSFSSHFAFGRIAGTMLSLLSLLLAGGWCALRGVMALSL